MPVYHAYEPYEDRWMGDCWERKSLAAAVSHLQYHRGWGIPFGLVVSGHRAWLVHAGGIRKVARDISPKQARDLIENLPAVREVAE